jgi:hypothetical protein
MYALYAFAVFAGAVNDVPGADVAELHSVVAYGESVLTGVWYVAFVQKYGMVVVPDAESVGAVAEKYTPKAEIAVVATVRHFILHHFS